MTRALLLGLLLLFAGCRAVDVEDEPVAGKRGEIVLLASWGSDEGRDFLIGGLGCTLKELEPGDLVVMQNTEPGKPLVFADLAAGTYEIKLQGQDREFTTDPLELGPGHRLTVRVDVIVAKDKVDRRKGVAFIGEGLVRLITAPFRLTAKVIEPDVEGKEGFPVDESPSGR
jgi:hypothetical protein